MKLLSKAAPVLLVKLTCAQTPVDFSAKKIEFGFSASTFVGSSVNYPGYSFLEKKDLYSYLPVGKPSSTFANFGWKQGAFLWVNLSSKFSYKAQVDLTLSVNQFKHISEKAENSYCKSLGIEYKPQLIIRLGNYNRNAVVKMAPAMSYYLTGRQNYLVIGPKFTYSKPDQQFLNDHDLKYTSVGAVIGYGTDNLFPNMDFAPEILLSLEYKTGRYYASPLNVNRYYMSLSVAFNFF